MLKKRLIASVIVKDGVVVQSIGFNRYLPVGRPEITVEYLTSWGIDEIALLDISKTANGAPPDFEMIRRVSKRCHVPLTVGGGISSVDHMRQLMHCGADKICLNHKVLRTPNLITEAAHVFGDQCVIVSIDAIISENDYFVYDYLGKRKTSIKVDEFAARVSALGAGEIFLNSVDRDGMKNGFDVELVSRVCAAVSVPVIACGGAGKPEHFLELFSKSNVSAGCAGNYFNYTEHSVTYAKSYLQKMGVDIRLDTYAHYKNYDLDANGRIGRQSEEYLDRLQYTIIPVEVI